MDQHTLSSMTRIAQRHFLEEGLRRVDICLGQLSEDQVWYRPNQSSNSVGIILTHLIGNITQYVISGLGDLPDSRRRDREFDDARRPSKSELRQALSATLQQAISVLQRLTPLDIRQEYRIQGFSLSFLDVVVHVIEHFSYHLGQVAYITKMVNDRQTGFYAGVDLNASNKPS